MAFTDTGMEAIEEPAALLDGDDKMRGLMQAVEASYESIGWARTLNRNLVREYHGPAYGAAAHVKEKPVNKMNQAIEAWTMLTAANAPVVTVDTNFEHLRAFARHYEQAINNFIKEIHLEETIRRWVLDAFLLVGIVKVHLKDSAPVMLETDTWMDPGTPFASNVSLDDWVFDRTARKWSEVRFAGDMYRIPFSDIQRGVDEGIYNEDVAAQLTPSSKYNDHNSEERLSNISRGDVTDTDDYEPMIDLFDCWVPRDQKIYTFVVNDRRTCSLKKLPPIAEMEWNEPDGSPYHILGLSDVPENILPLSPMAHMQVLDRTINSLARKQIDQAERQKTNPVYSPAGKDTILNVKDAPDGFAVKGDPKEIGMFTNPGPDQNNQAFMLLLIELFDNFGGNIPALLGLGPQAGTVGQEQLIHDAGNRKVGQMQYRVVEATQKLIRSLGWMLWEDQWKTITSQLQVEGTPYSVPSVWKPGDREGNFQDFNFAVGVHSMPHRPPAMKAEMLLGYLERIYLPLAPVLAQQGVLIDFQTLTTELADLQDLDVLKRIVTFTTPPPEEPLQPQDTSKPDVTTRRYERRNVPTGGSPQSRMQVMRQALTSAGGVPPTPQQTASAALPMAG